MDDKYNWSPVQRSPRRECATPRLRVVRRSVSMNKAFHEVLPGEYEILVDVSKRALLIAPGGSYVKSTTGPKSLGGFMSGIRQLNVPTEIGRYYAPEIRKDGSLLFLVDEPYVEPGG